MKRYPVALTIAGSDCSGGAGVQADLKTFSALGVYGASAITSIVAENTQGVQAIEAVSPEMLKQQIISVFDDIQVDAVKIGMLHAPDIVAVVAECIDRFQPKWVVLDPVMIATSGDMLIEPDTVDSLKKLLFNRATIITPNLDEAAFLSGMEITNVEEMHIAGKILLEQGCRNVLMKGGHLKGEQITDILLLQDGESIEMNAPYIDTQNTHGTGCTLSSAIAGHLALGYSLTDAVKQAKTYITNALNAGKDIALGKGHGPVNHFFDPKILGSKE